MEEAADEARQYSTLCEKWGPSAPIARIAEIRSKPPLDLMDWVKNCRQRAVYATGRGNGDGFWEAKARWYSERAAWLEERIPSDHLSRKRKDFFSDQDLRTPPSGKWTPTPKRRELQPAPLMPSDGGWPSGVPASHFGPTPSGSPTGEKKDSSLSPASPSPSPSDGQTGLDEIRENY